MKKHTKIIATLGPKSRTKEMMWKLHQAGANIFRMNFSHGDHEDHMCAITWVRELNEEHGTNITLLQDLQGPKIRVNQVEGGDKGFSIAAGDTIKIESGDFLGSAEKISTTYKTIARDVKVGDPILIDDGNLELKVVATDGTTVTAEVIFGGMLKSRKGINLPSTAISEPSLTEKDLIDLEFGIKHDVDWIALSFVRTAADIIDIKERIAKAGKDIKVICKMEKPEAIDNMDAIIAATDAVMVARGDLGVEVDMATVPMIQKEMIAKCNKARKPVVVATQMLESMITNPRPTRAEASDVANAITDGTDVVMLSGETAAGDYPVHAVEAMTRIIDSVESQADFIYNKFEPVSAGSPTKLHDSLVFSACRLAEYTEAKAIVCMSGTGFTGYTVASHRPKADIFVFTANKKLVTRLNLVWGVRAYYYEKQGSTDETVEDVNQILVEKGVIKKGDVVINTASTPVWKGGHTNMVRAVEIE